MTDYFPNLIKHINLQIQDSEHTPNRKSLKKLMPAYIRTELLKYQDKAASLEAARERDSLPVGRKQLKRQWISHQKPRRSEEEAQVCSRAERKTAASPALRAGAPFRTRGRSQRLSRLQTWPERRTEEGP